MVEDVAGYSQRGLLREGSKERSERARRPQQRELAICAGAIAYPEVSEMAGRCWGLFLPAAAQLTATDFVPYYNYKTASRSRAR